MDSGLGFGGNFLTELSAIILCRYLTPEYAENDIVSVRTDVYSFGIVLLQLISGHNVINENQEEQSQSLLQWVPKTVVQQIFLLNRLDVELCKHAQDIFAQQWKHLAEKLIKVCYIF
ncbi:probable serine/threonine-protein kinase PBL11 [Magnolia sinica]|uniref:probable serine/threonine-protein kinase PBL11 n=1 Tax=Magnolia sinica TaxID=86752 RepID=UPI0026588226|nr:probable serine/threonine-protein kinase PBL11 [Magnolia sinica]